MKNKAKALVLSAAVLSSAANGIDLSGTVFDKAAKAHNLDPLLVYSVALAESASGRGNGSISPWPWTLRVPGLPFYAKSEDQAKAKLAEFQQQYGRAIDVGFMQVSVRWNGHRVSSPAELLDPETNVMVGAEDTWKEMVERVYASDREQQQAIFGEQARLQLMAVKAVVVCSRNLLEEIV